MTNFLSTFIFLIPGILAYFWIQFFGLTPTVKHTAPEFSGIAAILWLPVSFVTILCLNLISIIFKIGILPIVWTIKEFTLATENLFYLLFFLLVSVIVSFILCGIWSIFLNNLLQDAINFIRKKRGLAPLSSSTTVWEEFFIKYEKKNTDGKEALYKIYKIDKPESYLIGSMTKGSRPTELDKSLVLEEVQEWKEYIDDNQVPIKRVYFDFKTNLIIEELDHTFEIDK